MRQSAQQPSFTPFGTVFRPIGFINGKPVWPVIGGAPEDGDGSSGTGDGDGKTGEGEQESQGNAGDGNDGTGDGSQSGKSGDDGEKTYTAAEYEALTRRMQAADRRASTAESEVKKRDDAEKTELERVQAENAELKKRDSERDEQFRTLQTKDAFGDASKAHKPPLDWHNSALAMEQLNRDLITVDDKGVVSGMDAAVKKLAADHPYLVKESDSEGGQASGGSFNGKKNNNNAGATDKTKLARKYRALQGRGGNLGT